MAKKRGGLAGVYDRNKGLIQKAVPAALSFIPGAGIPLAAAAGAAMRGLDRPGKSGIGFDPYAGLKGGVEGYAIGKGTQAIAGGIKGLLTAGAKAPSASMAGAPVSPGGYQVGFQGIGMPLDSASPVGAGIPDLPAFGAKVGMTGPANLPDFASKVGMTPGFGASQAAIGGPSLGAMPNVVKDLAPRPGVMSQLGSAASAAGKFARENKDLIAMAGKGIMSTQPQPGEEAAMMNAETGRMRLEEEQRQAKMEEERKQRIAQLLMPYIQQNYGSLFPRQG